MSNFVPVVIKCLNCQARVNACTAYLDEIRTPAAQYVEFESHVDIMGDYIVDLQDAIEIETDPVRKAQMESLNQGKMAADAGALLSQIVRLTPGP